MASQETTGSGKRRLQSLRLVLNDLAALIAQAWSEYEARSQAPVNSEMRVASNITGTHLGPSTQQMLRRIDALLAPYAHDGDASPSKH